MKKCTEKCLAIFSYGTLFLAYSFVAVVTFWLSYPYQPVEYIDLPYRVDRDVVYQGGELTYSFRYCAETEVKATVRREFIDGLIYLQETAERMIPSGCGERRTTIEIPKNLPAGEYKMRTTATIRVNPIREIKIINNTEHFTVLEKE